MVLYLKALALFYRSVLPFTLLLSGLLLVAARFYGGTWPPPVAPLLFQKLLTFPAVIYLQAQFRPHQYWFYRNLHLSPRQLWGGVIAADTLLLLLVLLVARFLS
ncbi:hypothetical protein K3G63_00190 [Hymenobacter sp. HSC-4F20]|uniref:hypothetical protein n=1 Tax=Hymenobacter sp. HSC-4F20 TaxID=2864135 RepID=UPI001C72E7A2|nr:hypothetical protein [Hymenobacter sp. HSC-4F20]MBX0288831.1 hypothetical protein [Hymenobacter sp. HSC-4F20]